MYKQVEQSNENKSRAIANSVVQKNRSKKQGFRFIDNRPEAVCQRRIGEVIQERLNINSWKSGYTERIKGALSRLLGGIDDSLAYENNCITPALRLIGLTSTTNVIKGARFREAEENKPKSAMLVGRLIDSGKTVYIQDGINTAAPIAEGNETVADTLTTSSFGEEAGEGRNARVNIDTETFEGGRLHEQTSVPVDNEGEPSREETPNQILLAHELIHADRITRGVSAFRGSSRYHPEFGKHNLPDERYNEEGFGSGATAKEDIFNIGLTPEDEAVVNPDEESITENDLRDEHELKRRVGY